MEINKQDKVHHETDVCKYRKVKCHDYEPVQDVNTLRASSTELDRKVEAMEKNMNINHVEIKRIVRKLEGSLSELDGKVEAVQNKMENNHVEEKKIVKKLEGSLVEMNKRVNEKVVALKDCHDEMKRDQCEVRNEVKKVKKEVKNVKEDLSKVNKDVNEVKVMMSQMLEKFSMLELINKLPSSTEDMMNTPREDILIAGAGDSAEMFSWEMNSWYEVEKMNEEHAGASSFIYNDQLFVIGGDTKTVETMDLTELPLKWTELPKKLPYEISDHQTTLYQQRVIYIGGCNYDDEEDVSNVISELQLTSLCAMKELFRMPDTRAYHGAEAFEDKVLILGGVDGDGCVSDSVLEFYPEKNECHEIASLPHPLTEMATVRWKDQIVVFGGRDEDGEVRNDVFMYDCKADKTTTLPSMLEKRYNCCAVISGNTMVVIGGENDDVEHSSVKFFIIGISLPKAGFIIPGVSKKIIVFFFI